MISTTSRSHADFSIDKGIIGLCARRQQVINVADIGLHPYCDAAADGIQRTGRPVNAHAAMLCGPLLIDSDDGDHGSSNLLGVVQLLERKKRKGGEPEAGGGGTSPTEFSLEDEALFKELLSVCAHAAWRTREIRKLSAQLNGQSVNMSWMMSG